MKCTDRIAYRITPKFEDCNLWIIESSQSGTIVLNDKGEFWRGGSCCKPAVFYTKRDAQNAKKRILRKFNPENFPNDKLHIYQLRAYKVSKLSGAKK